MELLLLLYICLGFVAGVEKKGRTEFVLSKTSISYVLHSDQLVVKEKITLVGCENCTFGITYATVHCVDEIGDKTPGVKCYDPIPFTINNVALHPRTCNVIWSTDTSPANSFDEFVFQCAYQFKADQIVAEYTPKSENRSIFAISFKVMEWADASIVAEFLVPQREGSRSIPHRKQFTVEPNTAVTFVATLMLTYPPPWRHQGVVLLTNCSYGPGEQPTCINMMYEGSIPGASFSKSYISNNVGRVAAYANALTMVHLSPINQSVLIIYDFIDNSDLLAVTLDHQLDIVVPPNYLWEFAEYPQAPNDTFWFQLAVGGEDQNAQRFRADFYLSRLEGGIFEWRNGPVFGNLTEAGQENGVQGMVTFGMEFTFYPDVEQAGKRGFLMLFTGVNEIVPQYQAAVELTDDNPIYMINVKDVYSGAFTFELSKNQTLDNEIFITGCVVKTSKSPVGTPEIVNFLDDGDTFSQNLTYATLHCQRAARKFGQNDMIELTIYNDTVKVLDSITFQLTSSLRAELNFYTVPIFGDIDRLWRLVIPKDDAKDSILALGFPHFDRKSFWMIEDIAWAHSESTCAYVLYPYLITERKNLTEMTIFSDQRSFPQQLVVGGWRSIFIPRGCTPTVSLRRLAFDFSDIAVGYTLQQCQGVAILTPPDDNDYFLRQEYGLFYTLVYYCDLHINVTIHIAVCEDAHFHIYTFNGDQRIGREDIDMLCVPTVEFQPKTWLRSNITKLEFSYTTAFTGNRAGAFYAEIHFETIVPKNTATPPVATSTPITTSTAAARKVTSLCILFSEFISFSMC